MWMQKRSITLGERNRGENILVGGVNIPPTLDRWDARQMALGQNSSIYLPAKGRG